MLAFEGLTPESGCSKAYENAIFRSQAGHRVRLEQVQHDSEGKCFQAQFVLLSGNEAISELGGEVGSEADPGATAPLCSPPAPHRMDGYTGSGGGNGNGQRRSSARALDSQDGQLETKHGDLLEAPEDYLVHVCNCVTKEEAVGITARIFEKFPEANVYLERQRGAANDVPGDVSVHGRVVNLYAQFAPGPALSKSGAQPAPEYEDCFRGLPPGKWDTAEDRMGWLRQCLAALPGKLPAEGPSGGRISLAFPMGVGCSGHTGDNWPDCWAELLAFAKSNPQLRVALYADEAEDQDASAH